MAKRPISVIEILDSTILQDKENIARYKKDNIPGVKMFEDKLLKDQQFEDEINNAFDFKNGTIQDPSDTIIERNFETVRKLGFSDYNHYLNDLQDRILKTTGIKRAIGWEDAVNYLKTRVKQYSIYAKNLEDKEHTIVPFVSLPPPQKEFIPEKITLKPLPTENQNSIFTGFNPLTRTDNPDGNLEKIKVALLPAAEGIKTGAAVTGEVVKVIAPAAKELLVNVLGLGVSIIEDIPKAAENWNTIKYILLAGIALFIAVEGKEFLS